MHLPLALGHRLHGHGDVLSDIRDRRGDLLRRPTTLLCQLSDLFGHHGEAATIADVRENIAVAVQSMTEGEREVHGVGEIANEANTALSTLLTGIGRIAELIADVTTVSREQSTTMHQLAEMIDGVEGVSDEAAVQARDASDAATRQMRALEGLADTSRSLASLAERLRRSTGRFTVPTLPASHPATPSPNDNAAESRDRIKAAAFASAPVRSLTTA
jgi:hypothetical protein